MSDPATTAPCTAHGEAMRYESAGHGPAEPHCACERVQSTPTPTPAPMRPGESVADVLNRWSTGPAIAQMVVAEVRAAAFAAARAEVAGGAADLEALAWAAAVHAYPTEHVGSDQPVPSTCRCDECYRREDQRNAYVAGFLAAAPAPVDADAVERAARALWIAEQRNAEAAEAAARFWDRPDYDDMVIPRPRYRKQARTALAAARGGGGEVTVEQARADALRRAADWVERLHPGGLVNRATVLADLREWAERAERGVAPSGNPWVEVQR